MSTHNFTMVSGFAFRVQVTLIAIDPVTNQEYPYPLTNRTVTAMAKPTANSCRAFAFDVVIIDELNGIIELQMDSALTSTIDVQSLVYDVRITDSSDPDWSYRAMNGSLNVEKEITD